MCAGLPDHDEPTNYYEILYNLGHNSLDNRGKLAHQSFAQMLKYI